jgi:hypothetical protein
LRIIRPTAAKVIAQIDFDAEFVRPFRNRLYQLFIRHALEFRLMAVLLDDGFGPGAFLLLRVHRCRWEKAREPLGVAAPAARLPHASRGLTDLLNPTSIWHKTSRIS